MARTTAPPPAPLPPGAVEAWYAARPGSGYSDADAEVIGAEITRLAAVFPAVTNEVIVQAAADPVSPLNRYIFAASTRDAAYRYRLGLAASVTGAVLIVGKT